MSIIREIKEQPLKPKARWRIGLALAVAIAIGGAINKLQQAHNQAAAKPVSNTKPVAAAVTALGRLEPQGEVIELFSKLHSSTEWSKS